MKRFSHASPSGIAGRLLLVCLIAVCAFSLATVSQSAQAAPNHSRSSQDGLVLEYGSYNASRYSFSIQPTFTILNRTGASVSLSDLTIRYWYTVDGAKDQRFWCDYARVGCRNVTGTFNTFSPATSTADSYLEVGFKGSGSIEAGENSGLIMLRFNKVGFSRYDQTNDFSGSSHVTFLQPYANVGLYNKGQLVWGVEPGTAANVTVNTKDSLGRIPTTAFGINEAVWDGNMLDAEVPGLLSDAGVKVIRYPGGSTSDVYHWQSNTTEPNQSYANPNNTFDAYMGVVHATGAQSVITVNYGSGTPQEAANWVQYANKGGDGYTGPVPSYPGASSTGHNYGVKYWEIGNEVYGNGTYGANWEYDLHEEKGPTAYGNNVVAYSQAMKAVDPSIKIGVMLTAPNNWPDGVTSDLSPQPWNDTVLPIACPSVDFVIAHWYAQNPGNESDSYLLSAPSQIADMVSTLRSKINQYCGDHAKDIQIMITETNSVSYNPGKQSTSLVNALFMDDDYMNWLENGVANVDWWTTHNSIVGGTNNSDTLYGDKQYGDYGVLSNGTCTSDNICEPAPNTPFPNYYGLQMLTHLGKAGDTMVSSTSDNNLLAVHAVKQANGKLAVMLINKDPNVTYDVKISLTGDHTSGNVTVYRYGKESSAISTSGLPVHGSTITVSVAPYSTNTIVLP